MTTHADIERSADVAAAAPALSQAARQIGDRQVRARGTIGGSLAHADPAADLPAVMLALDASMVMRSSAGERTMAADDFFVGLLEIGAASGRAPDRGARPCQPALGLREGAEPGLALRHRRRRGRPRRGARASASPALRPSPSARPAPNRRCAAAGLDAALAARAAAQAYDGRELLSDIHASDEYRAHLIEVSTRRALARLAG